MLVNVLIVAQQKKGAFYSHFAVFLRNQGCGSLVGAFPTVGLPDLKLGRKIPSPC